VTIEKVSPGQAFRPSARVWNTFVEMANSAPDATPAKGTRVRPLHIVRCRNDSGSDREQWDVLGVKQTDGLVVTAAENDQESIDQRFVLVGEAPAWPDHIGRWAMCIEQIPDGSIGLVALGGIIAAQITVVHADHDRADILYNGGSGGNGQLESDWQGAAEILTKQSGTGTKWAVLRIADWSYTALQGVAQATIGADSSGAVQIEWGGSASETKAAVWNDHLHGGNAVGNGKDVSVNFNRSRGRWWIEELEC